MMLQASRPLHAVTRVALLLSTVLLTACFPIRFDARMPLPEPLIAKVPATVAVRMPPEFASFTQKEKRDGLKWEVNLGKAQTEGFTQLLNAMFDRVIMVDSVDAATHLNPAVRAILEPTIDEYAFVTSRETGSPFFAVSIKYRMGIYTPEGKLADSWAFTGYGSATTAGMSDKDTLSRATTLALRDAAAKLAVEFRDQEIVRELLPPDGSAPQTEPANREETDAAGESGEQSTPTASPASASQPSEAPATPASPPASPPETAPTQSDEAPSTPAPEPEQPAS